MQLHLIVRLGRVSYQQVSYIDQCFHTRLLSHDNNDAIFICCTADQITQADAVQICGKFWDTQ